MALALGACETRAQAQAGVTLVRYTAACGSQDECWCWMAATAVLTCTTRAAASSTWKPRPRSAAPNSAPCSLRGREGSVEQGPWSLGGQQDQGPGWSPGRAGITVGKRPRRARGRGGHSQAVAAPAAFHHLPVGGQQLRGHAVLRRRPREPQRQVLERDGLQRAHAAHGGRARTQAGDRRARLGAAPTRRAARRPLSGAAGKSALHVHEPALTRRCAQCRMASVWREGSMPPLPPPRPPRPPQPMRAR